MNFNIYAEILLILSIMTFILYIYSVFQARSKLASAFSNLCLAMTIYIFFYSLELMSTKIITINFFLKLENFGILTIPPLWFLLAYKFYHKKSYSLKMITLIFVIPFLSLLAAITNDYHHLFYKEISVIMLNHLYLSQLKKGIFYVIAATYSYVMLILGQFLFYKAWKKSSHSERIQAKIFFVGSIVTLVFSIIYLTGGTPGNVDIMPFSYAIFCVLSYIAIFKYEFLEMKEVVREISFEQINEGIVVANEKNRLIDFNLTAQKTFSFLNQSNIGVELDKFSNDIFFESKNFYEVKYKKRYYEFRSSKITEKNKFIGKIYIFLDITEKKQMINKLQYSAKYDFLSKVFNRHELFELAEIEVYKAYRYKKKIAFLMIDIDSFKKINDKYGHVAGDMVIQKLAKICKERLRPSDIIGRYGGEEFLIILTEITQENSIKIAEEIRKTVYKSPIIHNEQKINFTISIGIKYYQGDIKQSLVELIDLADKALYSAKQTGRNKIVEYLIQD